MAKIDKKKIDYKKARITKLRAYLMNIIDELLTDKDYQINADMLSNDPINYSLNKIPTASVVETLVTGQQECRDVYSFSSRMNYSEDTITNLTNIGFFEIFEEIIESNNNKGILPKIDGIKSIECLNPGTINSATSNTAEFDIQIQITYIKEED